MTETNEPVTDEIAAEQLEAGTAGQHEDGHEHSHDHGHEHQHGPSLNPELTREIEVEAPAEEVSKAFRAVIKVSEAGEDPRVSRGQGAGVADSVEVREGSAPRGDGGAGV